MSPRYRRTGGISHTTWYDAVTFAIGSPDFRPVEQGLEKAAFLKHAPCQNPIVVANPPCRRLPASTRIARDEA
jgi:hypothetical protein